MSESNDSNPLSREENVWQELMGPELLMKKMINRSDTASVQPQDAVTVDFVGYASVNKDETQEEEASVFHSAKDWMVIVGEKDVVPALELAVRFMNVGETALVWSHSKYAYGHSSRVNGEYALPPHSNVAYRVTVTSIIDEKERDEPAFLIKYSTAKKEIGNDVFASEWDLHQGKAKAMQLYSRGASNLQLLVQRASENEDRDLAERASSLMIDCLNNVVAVHLRAKEYHSAKQAAVKVLEIDPRNAKALLRAAKAALLDPASSYEEVKAALDAASETDGADEKELSKLRAQFQQQRQEYRKRAKDFASKMMASDTSSIPGRPFSAEATRMAPSEVPTDELLPSDGKDTKDESLRKLKQEPTDDAVPAGNEREQLTVNEVPQQLSGDVVRDDWDVKTLLYFLLKQLLIAGAIFAYSKWGHPQGGKGRAATEL